MPLILEKKLKKAARKRGYGKERTNAYVYGTLNKLKGGGRTYKTNYQKKP